VRVEQRRQPAIVFFEAAHARGTLHYFQVPIALRFAPIGSFLATVGCIGPDLLETWDEAFQSRQESTCTLRVVHVGGRHRDGDREPQGINQEMPFASLDVLVSVISTERNSFPLQVQGSLDHSG